MKILILGGTGAMGVALVPLLLGRENEIYVTTRSKRNSQGNVRYLQGNAHDIAFLQEILVDSYDVIVDFMVYTSKEFEDRIDLLLSSTKQYVFLSSSRVYADAKKERITEEFPRLLDVCEDQNYLKLDEYALAKARQENLLHKSPKRNWTIIRPYITYNDQRLQLGVDEKETWLYRALEGKTIVFPLDIADKYTTLTYGCDVAKVISQLVGNPKAFGETFHITTEQSVKWKDVLNLYLEVIERETGNRPEVYMLKDAREMSVVCKNQYQVYYDRLYDRRFCVDKVNNVIGEPVQYMDIKDGLEKCLTNFIRNEQKPYPGLINVRKEAYFDKITKEKSELCRFKTFKAKILYVVLRYTFLKL